uniref:Epoxide hydrolase N-terminal domain-containing protein n=1 Tax=Moniliophthora roreri TaxID=221103 RepID=A0A0W0G109_MONRR
MPLDVEIPFRIAISDTEIDSLRVKLNLTRFPDELENAGWNYGVPLGDMRRLVARWKDWFDWRAAEAQLNIELPQFTKNIEVENHGVLNIHYVHQKSEVERAIPLLFVHGWPGSFIEVRKILPLLVKVSSKHPSFHVVALSLPGYGFSEAPKHPGFKLAQYAEVANKLMLSLGYNEYVTQGGDWGWAVTRKIAELYGNVHCKAGSPPTFLKEPLLYLRQLITPFSASEKAGFERSAWMVKSGMGYFREQSTQPQTLGYSLADSPVGLLAWIYEKLVHWTDSYPWTDDEVLTWISIYYFSRAGPAASLRIYYEIVQSREFATSVKPSIPLGVSYFPKELSIKPRLWTRTIGNLVFEVKHSSGGHFAAYEEPGKLVADLRKMFGKGGPAYGVVTERKGYGRRIKAKL